MRQPDEYIDLAHDTAAAETDTEERRGLYRQLYAMCLYLGRWGDARIFQPFTGGEIRETDARKCLGCAIAYGRVEDALELGEYLGYRFDHAELRSLAKSLDRPGGPALLRKLLEVAAFAETPFDTEDWIRVSFEYGRGRLTESEQAAFRILFRSLRLEVVPAPDPDSDEDEG